MRAIPKKLRDDMAADPFYKQCAITKSPGHVEWHHHLIFAGRQVNEKFCILPLRKDIHDRVHEPKIKRLCDWIMLNRATPAQLIKYSKAVDLIRYRNQLNEELGKWTTKQMITPGMVE